jgi:hypothetical protein
VKDVPYVINTSWYPTHKTTEVAQKYFEMLEKYPSDDSLGEGVVPVAVTTTPQGIKTMGITEIKEGKLEEALTRFRESMVMFHDIEGFEYSIEVYMTVVEALGLIGMSLPE